MNETRNFFDIYLFTACLLLFVFLLLRLRIHLLLSFSLDSAAPPASLCTPSQLALCCDLVPVQLRLRHVARRHAHAPHFSRSSSLIKSLVAVNQDRYGSAFGYGLPFSSACFTWARFLGCFWQMLRLFVFRCLFVRVLFSCFVTADSFVFVAEADDAPITCSRPVGRFAQLPPQSAGLACCPSTATAAAGALPRELPPARACERNPRASQSAEHPGHAL